MSLLFSHLSLNKLLCNEKITAVDHAVDHVATRSRADQIVSPLLNHHYLHLFEFQSYNRIVFLWNNIALRFEDTLGMEICIPGVSPGRDDEHDNLSLWRRTLAYIGVDTRVDIALKAKVWFENWQRSPFRCKRGLHAVNASIVVDDKSS